MFNKKRDDKSEFGKLSEEEKKKRLEEFRNSLDKDDERAMIFAALKTFLPPVLVFLLIIYLFAKLLG
ncbi:hypothetical protein ACQRBF_04425 [Peptoniphilaceae bacterium SGI.131]